MGNVRGKRRKKKREGEGWKIFMKPVLDVLMKNKKAIYFFPIWLECENGGKENLIIIF